MQGASISPRVMENFSSSASQLSTALTGENNNISQLTTAVNNLAPVTKGLQDTVNQLTKLVKDGIKLDQQASANVNVTFENGIPLETETGLDSKITANIRGLLEDTLGAKFNKFVRDILT